MPPSRSARGAASGSLPAAGRRGPTTPVDKLQRATEQFLSADKAVRAHIEKVVQAHVDDITFLAFEDKRTLKLYSCGDRCRHCVICKCGVAVWREPFRQESTRYMMPLDWIEDKEDFLVSSLLDVLKWMPRVPPLLVLALPRGCYDGHRQLVLGLAFVMDLLRIREIHAYLSPGDDCDFHFHGLREKMETEEGSCRTVQDVARLPQPDEYLWRTRVRMALYKLVDVACTLPTGEIAPPTSTFVLARSAEGEVTYRTRDFLPPQMWAELRRSMQLMRALEEASEQQQARDTPEQPQQQVAREQSPPPLFSASTADDSSPSEGEGEKGEGRDSTRSAPVQRMLGTIKQEQETPEPPAKRAKPDDRAAGGGGGEVMAAAAAAPVADAAAAAGGGGEVAAAAAAEGEEQATSSRRIASTAGDNSGSSSSSDSEAESGEEGGRNERRDSRAPSVAGSARGSGRGRGRGRPRGRGRRERRDQERSDEQRLQWMAVSDGGGEEEEEGGQRPNPHGAITVFLKTRRSSEQRFAIAGKIRPTLPELEERIEKVVEELEENGDATPFLVEQWRRIGRLANPTRTDTTLLQLLEAIRARQTPIALGRAELDPEVFFHDGE